MSTNAEAENLVKIGAEFSEIFVGICRFFSHCKNLQFLLK